MELGFIAFDVYRIRNPERHPHGVVFAFCRKRSCKVSYGPRWIFANVLAEWSVIHQYFWHSLVSWCPGTANSKSAKWNLENVVASQGIDLMCTISKFSSLMCTPCWSRRPDVHIILVNRVKTINRLHDYTSGLSYQAISVTYKQNREMHRTLVEKLCR